MNKRYAWFTYDSEGPAYYFAVSDRASPPYKEQRHVTAILDVASDGTLAGVELVHVDLPVPPVEKDPENLIVRAKKLAIQRDTIELNYRGAVKSKKIIETHAAMLLELIEDCERKAIQIKTYENYINCLEDKLEQLL